MLKLNFNNLIGIGEIILITFCCLFMTVIVVDSITETTKQSSLHLEKDIRENTMSSQIYIRSNNMTPNVFVKSKLQRKRNFMDIVRKYYTTACNTTTTCTPFFIRRSKRISKKPIHINTLETYFSVDSTPAPFETSRGKIKNLFFPKHKSTTLFNTTSSVQLAKKSKYKNNSEDTVWPTELPSEDVNVLPLSTINHELLTFNGDKYNVTPRYTTSKYYTVKNKNEGILGNYKPIHHNNNTTPINAKDYDFITDFVTLLPRESDMKHTKSEQFGKSSHYISGGTLNDKERNITDGYGSSSEVSPCSKAKLKEYLNFWESRTTKYIRLKKKTDKSGHHATTPLAPQARSLAHNFTWSHEESESSPPNPALNTSSTIITPYITVKDTGNSTKNKFHFKEIIHFKTPVLSTSSDSNNTQITLLRESTFKTYLTSIQPTTDTPQINLTTTVLAYPETNMTTKVLPPKEKFLYLKKVFNIHHKLKHNPDNVSTEQYGVCVSKEPDFIQTTLETQITSPPSQAFAVSKLIQDNSDLLPSTNATYTGSNVGKHLDFEIFHKKHKTADTSIKEKDDSGKESYWVSTTSNVEWKIPSTQNFPNRTFQHELEANTFENNGMLATSKSENHFKNIFNFKKEQHKKESQDVWPSTTEMSDGQDRSTLMKNDYNNTMDVSKFDFKEYLSNAAESEYTTTVHSPFKIKYLFHFKNPAMSSVPSNGSFEPEPSNQTNTPAFDGNNYRVTTTQHFEKITEFVTIQSTNIVKHKGLMGHNSIEKTVENNNVQPSTSKLLKETKVHQPLKLSTMMGLNTTEFFEITTNVYKKTCEIPYIESEIFPIRNYYNKSAKQQDFKENFKVNIPTTNTYPFREWVFGRRTTSTRHKINSNNCQQNEEGNIFKWRSKAPPNNFSPQKNPPMQNYPVNYTSFKSYTTSSHEAVEDSENYKGTSISSFPTKRFQNIFHLKSSEKSSAKFSSITTSNSDKVTKAYLNSSKFIETNVTRNYEKGYRQGYNTNHSETNTAMSNVTLLPWKSTRGFHPTIMYCSVKIYNPFAKVSFQPLLNSTNITQLGTKNCSTIKIHSRKKVKKRLRKFHRAKFYLFNNTNGLDSNLKNKSYQSNSTVLINPEYSDYVENKMKMKGHRGHYNKTIAHNATDVNDTSFNIMAYVMKPFDSLVSVFRAPSPDSIAKIGDINTTDITNRTLPDRLQTANSSIVILAVNNTNNTSKDIHESKLSLALDLLGGVYHCVFNNFVEVKPEDVHFYLYTRNNADEPEILILPKELPSDENATDTPYLPEPVFEQERIRNRLLPTEPPMDKREVEDEDEDGDYEFEPLSPAKSDIESKWFNLRSKTKVIIHGYLQDYQTDIMVNMKEAYLSQGSYNVIVVDWSVIVSESSCYPEVASKGLRQVGELLARLLNHLIEAGVSPRHIHIVGFSLGAHVAGHAGTFLNHGLVSRITGLDPALPYVPMEADVSLDSDDAVFVDIIHSAAGLLGQSGPMGHVDFYPNGGSQQPGCEMSSLSCSHRRAALYFIESIISNTGFQATKCDSWHYFQAGNCSEPSTLMMGEQCLSNASGKYYLFTGYKSPFALLPEEHVKVEKSMLLDLIYDFEDL